MTVPDEYAGRNINCPHCSQLMTAPSPQPQTPAPQSPAGEVPMARPISQPTGQPQGQQPASPGQPAVPPGSGVGVGAEHGQVGSSVEGQPAEEAPVSAAVLRARQAKQKSKVLMIVGIVCAVIGLPIVICCGGCFLAGDGLIKQAKEVDKSIKASQKIAYENTKTALGRMGYPNAKFLADCEVIDLGAAVEVKGSADTPRGRITFHSEFSVTAREDGGRAYVLERLQVDGEEVYKK